MRRVIVKKARPTSANDAARVVGLLATGLERLLTSRLGTVDLPADESVTTTYPEARGDEDHSA
jgi:hypothetical protein